MADDALRELLAKFTVEVDPDGNLAKGHTQVDALKAALATLEERLKGVQAKAAPAAKAVEDVWSRAGKAAQRNLQALNAAQLGGRSDNNGWGQAGLLGRSGPLVGPQFETRSGAMLGPDRGVLDANVGAMQGPTRDTLNTFQQSWRGRLQALGAGARVAGASATAAFAQFKVAGDAAQSRVLSLRNAFLGFGALGAARGIAHIVDEVGSLGERAQKLGVGVEEFQRLDVLAKQNNTSVEALGGAFRALTNAATDPTKETTAAFKKLGIETKTGAGAFKSRNDLFFESAEALADVKDETARAGLAQKLFGRGALELLPLLSNGSEGIREQRAELMKLAVVSEAESKAADQLGDAWIAATASLRARLSKAIIEHLPLIRKVSDFMFKAADAVINFGKRLDVSRIALAAAVGAALIFGKTLALAGARAALAWGPLLLAFLALEDALSFLDGDDSLTGRLADKLFGPGGADRLRSEIQDIIDAIKELIGLGDGSEIGKNAIRKVGQDLLGITPNGADAADQQAQFAADRENSPITAWISDLLKPANFDADLIAARAAAGTGPAITDNSTKNVTVNVGTTAEVAGAVAGATQGIVPRSAEADFAAVGGDS